MTDADDVIRWLGLEPHPEGGWFRETWRDPGSAGARGIGSAIFYLLRAGERSHWHRFDAHEIWHFYCGDPLQHSLSSDGQAIEQRVLGVDVSRGQRPQSIVPAGVWQSAWPLGSWTLAGCTVSPAFEFEGFELAPWDWRPGS